MPTSHSFGAALGKTYSRESRVRLRIERRHYVQNDQMTPTQKSRALRLLHKDVWSSHVG